MFTLLGYVYLFGFSFLLGLGILSIILRVFMFIVDLILPGKRG